MIKPNEEQMKLINEKEVDHYLRYQHSPLEAGNPFTKGAEFGLDLGHRAMDAEIEEYKAQHIDCSNLLDKSAIEITTLEEKLRVAMEAMKKAHDADEFECIYPKGPSILKEALAKLNQRRRWG